MESLPNHIGVPPQRNLIAMKINLFICFLFFSIFTFGKEDREIIKQIDNINSSALKSYNNDEIVKSFKEFISAKELSDSIQVHYGSATAS